MPLVQLNARVQKELRSESKDVAHLTGIKLELIVEDSLRAAFDEADATSLARLDLVRKVARERRNELVEA